MIEVESKLKVSNPQELREKIKKLAHSVTKIQKIDDYYTLENLSSYPKKSLRIRKTNGKYVINFKQRISYKDGIYAKKETEFTTSDINGFLALIKDFGYKKWLTKEKNCEVYEIRKNFHVELNQVKNLGWFIEIEYLTDEKGIQKVRKEILKVMKNLGFANKQIEKSGYTKMLWNKKLQSKV